MIRFLKRLLCLALCVVFFTLCGCGEEGTDSTVFADIGEKIVTLDPQLVTSPSEITVVHNLFEGLTRIDKEGNAVLACAESYEKNGNTYTFHLKDGLLWNDGTPLTADDFVFALRRAARADTAAPDFQYISSIMGASAVRNGADVKKLAVNAADEKTLSITLEYDDGKLLYYLSKPICMPCNEEFFKDTNGKYGRDRDSVLCNGPFRLRTWAAENYALRLKRNENYNGKNKAMPASVYVTQNEDEALIEKLADGKIDLSYINSAHFEKLKEAPITIDKHFNKCWFIVINKASALGDDDTRRALCLSVSREAVEKALPPYISPLLAFVPKGCELSGEGIYDGVVASRTPVYDPNTAYNLYSAAIRKKQTQEQLAIIFPENEGIDSAVTSVAASWQENLGCFINMTAYSSNSSVMNAIKNGEFTVAVCALEANDADAYEFLQNFKSGNAFGFKSAAFDKNLSALRTESDTQKYLQTVIAMQDSLLSQNVILPLISTPTMLGYDGGLKQVHYNVKNGYIDFTGIIKQ